MTFQVFLKDGRDFTVKAENFSCIRNTITGDLCSYEFTGVSENKPCFLNAANIIAVIRKISDETVVEE